MFTIFWLIQSNQGTLDKDDTTIWQDDWFMATMLTVLCIGIDFLLGVLLAQYI